MNDKEVRDLSDEDLAQIIEACCMGYWKAAGREAARRLRVLAEIEKSCNR